MSEETRVINVLLVEDREAESAAISRKLEKNTEHIVVMVKIVGSLNAAETVLSMQRFDVVLLDLSLPDSHGVDSVIKINRVSPNTPIVVMSGREDLEVAERCLEAGAYNFIVKQMNISSDLLVRELLYAIKKNKLQLKNKHKVTSVRKILGSKTPAEVECKNLNTGLLSPHLASIESTVNKVLVYLAANSPTQFTHVRKMLEQDDFYDNFNQIRSVLDLEKSWESTDLDYEADERVRSASSPEILSEIDADEAIARALAGLDA